MRYCIIKNTTILIDGSNNSDEVMLQNAIDNRHTEEEVETLTEEEYKIRSGEINPNTGEAYKAIDFATQ